MADLSSRAPTFTLDVAHADGHIELLLIGEADLAATPMLRAALEQFISDGQRDLTLNLSALQFIDAGTIGCLVDINGQLLDLGGRLRLIGVRGIPLRILTICGLLDTLAPDDSAYPGSEPPHASRKH